MKRSTWTTGLPLLAVLLTTFSNVNAREGLKVAPTINGKNISLITAFHGEEVNLRCKAMGIPRPYKIWYRNGVDIENNLERINVTKHTLTIRPVYYNDSAYYACHAQNQKGEAWRNFTLVVTFGSLDQIEHIEKYKEIDMTKPHPPVWKKAKTDDFHVLRPVGFSQTFKCPYLGNPQPKLSWLKNGQRFVHRESGPFQTGKFYLRLDELVWSDTANYTCVVKNEYGIISWTYKLDVVERYSLSPVFKERPMNTTAALGEDATFVCRVISDPQAHIQWLKHYKVNGSFYDPITHDPHVRVVEQSSVINPSRETLTIRNVTYEDGGWYTCLAGNDVGFRFKSAWLIVIAERRYSTPHRTHSTDNPCYKYEERQVNSAMCYRINISSTFLLFIFRFVLIS